MTRFLAIAAILVAGVCTTAMNWRFSYQLGTSEWDSYTWAVFSVALDVTKWLMLPFAAVAWANHKARALAAVTIWMVATVYSFTAAVGFAALNRTTVAAERQSQTELHKTLETMKKSPRWQASAACADATAKASKEFCDTYRGTEAKLHGVTVEADPQADLFARLTGWPPDTVRLVFSLFLAVACEVISALGLFAILPARPTAEVRSKTTPSSPRWRPPEQYHAAATTTLTPTGDAPRHDAAGHDKTRRGAKWKSPR